MKRKMVLAVAAILLVLQAQTVFAADYDEDFMKEVGKNDFRAMERILERRPLRRNRLRRNQPQRLQRQHSARADMPIAALI